MTGSPNLPEETPYRRPAGYPQRYRDLRFQSGSGPRTHRREVRAIAQLLGSIETLVGPWLDLACGAGRLSAMLPQPVLQVDRDYDMLQACQDGFDRVCARALALPFDDKIFKGALCMRLMQHIPGPEERRAILSELARVTDGPILVSFFNSFSLQHGRRLISKTLGRPRSGRGAISLKQFAQDLCSAGLQEVAALSLCPLISEQRIVLARTKGGGAAAQQMKQTD